jgi:alpha,alpha-trehalase
MTTPPRDDFDAYLPIADYAVIGNQYTTAVISRDGAVVWCCFPELKDGSVFASLLDHRRGGTFRLAPADPSSVVRDYVDGTAVLTTSYTTTGGRLSVTDFMPLRGSIVGCGGGEAPPEMHRIVRCESGRVEVHVEWRPRFDYARSQTSIERRADVFVARAGAEVLALGGLPQGGVGRDAKGESV